MEMIADSRLSGADRLALMREVPAIFRARWLPRMQHEAAAFQADLPNMLTRLRAAEPIQAGWMARSLIEALQGLTAIVPEIDLTADRFEITALGSDWTDQTAGRMRSLS